MIKFADEMTPIEVEVAARQGLFNIPDRGIDDTLHRCFMLLKKKNLTLTSYFVEGSKHKGKVWGIVTMRTKYESSTLDRNPDIAKIRAAIGYLMPEGFDFPD